MTVEDEVKDSSLAALNALREAGLSVIMATDDGEQRRRLSPRALVFPKRIARSGRATSSRSSSG